MNLSILSVIISGLILCSCVSTGQFNHYKQTSDSKIALLENKIANFEQSYNPQMHEILNQNINVSKQHFKQITAIYESMKITKQNSDYVVDQTNQNAEIVANNAETSSTQNVVNEFYHLEQQWFDTLNDMDDITDQLILLSENAEHSADVARREAISADDRAFEAEKKLAQIEDYSRALSNLKQEIFKIQYTLDQEQYVDNNRTTSQKTPNEHKSKHIINITVDKFPSENHTRLKKHELNKSILELYLDLRIKVDLLEKKLEKISFNRIN